VICRGRIGVRTSAALMFVIACAGAALADSGPTDAVTTIRSTLALWTDDFNGRRADKVCDLFAKDAVSEFRGQPEHDRDEICTLLKQSVNDKAKSYSYAVDMKEVIATGDLAIVRLVWTLTVSPMNAVSVEPAMDVLRHEPDGKWRIMRAMGYAAPTKPE
jgi:uncharacterized protein (TIGR02246 family)